MATGIAEPDAVILIPKDHERMIGGQGGVTDLLPVAVESPQTGLVEGH
jgi:hypothetical protein